MERTDEQLHRLLSHIEELCDRAVRGQLTHTDFLTPREQKHAVAVLRRMGHAHRARLHGGYASAERCCLLLFPDYALDACDEDADPPTLLAMAGEEDPVTALHFRAGGYRTLSHRDYLGSLLSLGLERDVLGDIAMDGNDATVLCLSRIAPFLLDNAERIGGDAVRVSETVLPPDFDGGRTFTPVHETVASPRLDCIVAALANISREAAQNAVRDGLVEVDYEQELRPDHQPDIPFTLTVRGKGKFIVRALGDVTRKGRVRLLADRYV